MPHIRPAAVIFALTLALSSAAAADLGDLPNPLATVRTGQWVQYRHNSVFGSAMQKQKVVSIDGEGDDMVITTESVMIIDDEVVDERTESLTYSAAIQQQRDSLADAADLVVTPTQIEVKGRRVDGVRVDFTQEEVAFSLYLAESVPLTGVVRMEVEGEEAPLLELMDFGEGE
jgi:hypothetical protein